MKSTECRAVKDDSAVETGEDSNMFTNPQCRAGDFTLSGVAQQ